MMYVEFNGKRFATKEDIEKEGESIVFKKAKKKDMLSVESSKFVESDYLLGFECEDHGKQTAKAHELSFFKRFQINYNCQHCIEEERLRLKPSIESAVKLLDEKNAEARLLKLNALKHSMGLSERNTYTCFDDYIVSNEQQRKAKDSADKFCEAIENGGVAKNMILTGSVGTGKTMLASAIFNRLFSDNDIGITTISKMIRNIKKTWRRDSEESEDDIIKKYANVDVLIIDEVGVQFDSDTEKMYIFEIMDARYQKMKPTILISNLKCKSENSSDITVESCIGKRTFDRLREDGGVVIPFSFDSQRSGSVRKVRETILTESEERAAINSKARPFGS